MSAILQPAGNADVKPVQQKSSRVFIVDDALENIRILVETLKSEYTIMFARSGEAALRLAVDAFLQLQDLFLAVAQQFQDTPHEDRQ